MITVALALLISLNASASAPDPKLSIEARALKPGEIMLVVVEGADKKEAPKGALAGRPLDFFPAASTGTWLALHGVDVDAHWGPLRLAAAARAPGAKKSFALDRDVEVEEGAPRLEPKEGRREAERARGETDRLYKLLPKLEDKRLFEGKFEALDPKLKAGRPVRASAAGKVMIADTLFYAGKTVLVDHGLGLTTMYSHLSRMSVKPGDVVKKGQVLGKAGATGRSAGLAPSWSARHKGARVDPYSLAALDLDRRLKPKSEDPLVRSPLCEKDAAADLPPAGRWGRPSSGLKGRARSARTDYAPGDVVSLVVEISNVGPKPAFVDFVRDGALRPVVLGVGSDPLPYDLLNSSRAATGPLTEQVKIPKGGTLCFEQSAGTAGPLLAEMTTSYALVYDTAWLYPSTAAVRAGVWRGRMTIPPAAVTVSTAPRAP